MYRTALLGTLPLALAVVTGDCERQDCDSPSNIFLQTAHHRQREEKYHWPSGRGRFPFFAVSENNAPFHVNSSLAWSWHHPEGRFHTLTYGTAVDNDLNVYLTCADAMRKFDKDGNLLWEHGCMPANFMNAPVIHQGMVYISDTKGGVRALDMKDGKRIWHTNVSETTGQDNGFNMVHKGVLFAAADWTGDSPQGPANKYVKALNASTGDLLWSYQPDMPIWNFLALFPDESSLVFQDMTGKAYRLSLEGKLMWKAGGLEGTWTDGGAALGPNGLVYTVNNNHPPGYMTKLTWDPPTLPGTLSAYDVKDGALKWQVTTPRPPNNAPAVGKVYGWDGLSVVIPVCQQVFPGATCDVNVYDANTGEPRWVFHGPTQKGLMQAGDLEGLTTRNAIFSLESGGSGRFVCLPNGWSAPTITADGTVFVGSEEGPIFALRDADGDGRVLGEQEVSSFDSKGAFSGSSSAAIAPQMMAIASCDSLFVFKA